MGTHAIALRAIGQIDDGRGPLLKDHEQEVGGRVDQRALGRDQPAGAPVPLQRKHKTQDLHLSHCLRLCVICYVQCIYYTSLLNTVEHSVHLHGLPAFRRSIIFR